MGLGFRSLGFRVWDSLSFFVIENCGCVSGAFRAYLLQKASDKQRTMV